jgi:hypothetical protein
MAKKSVRGGKTTSAVKLRAVRMDLTPAHHKRLERAAQELGLSMAAYARMVLLERLKADESK